MKNLKFDPENWDWYAFLNASKEVKEKYSNEACNLSGGWVTCACGQLCDVLPKDGYAVAPLDNKLVNLGLSFCDNIEDKYWGKAKETLDKIEERTIFLLKQPNFIDPKTL